MTTRSRSLSRSRSRSNAAPASEGIAEPRDTDVLFGRGGHVNHHPMNQRYLQMVIDRKQEYGALKKAEKAKVAWDIIEELKAHDPPARFLKKDYSEELWYPVPEKQVRRKISQCLRERSTPVIVSTKRKSRRTKKLSPISFPPAPSEVEVQSPKASGFASAPLNDDDDDEMPPLPPLPKAQEERQTSFQSQRNEHPVDHHSEEEENDDENNQVLEEAPRIPVPSRFGGGRDDSARTLSDLFSFGLPPTVSTSFNPTIFDTSVGSLGGMNNNNHNNNNHWESLYDPTTSSLPQLRSMEDDEALQISMGMPPKSATTTTTSMFSQSTETLPVSNSRQGAGRCESSEIMDLFFTNDDALMAMASAKNHQVRSYSATMDSE